MNKRSCAKGSGCRISHCEYNSIVVAKVLYGKVYATEMQVLPLFKRSLGVFGCFGAGKTALNRVHLNAHIFG